ncbi:Relaxin receptor 2-like Protein [Tribolium castaneum]|uniref:Relaxin receptor 2-like Protein n=1 Tax=Tribolium castaneum TaxID=7070 RepID=A0A139WGB5_TRICA|nr:Relaxin receptor 2-like Protein [Tribolium castaneum]
MEVYFLIGVFLVNAPQRTVTGLEQNKICPILGYFQCENTTICIPQQNNCDGKVDCPGGSDEVIGCDDRAKDDYWDHQFKKRPSALNDHLAHICNLSYNGSCVCRGRDLLCGHKNMVKIPGDLPADNITLLDFEGNNFGVLSGNVLEKVPLFVEKM